MSYFGVSASFSGGKLAWYEQICVIHSDILVRSNARRDIRSINTPVSQQSNALSTSQSLRFMRASLAVLMLFSKYDKNN